MLIKLARRRFAANYGRALFSLAEYSFFAIEPETCLAMAGVGAMTTQAIFGKDRANVAIKADVAGLVGLFRVRRSIGGG